MPITSDSVFTYGFILCVVAIACAIPLYSLIRRNAPERAWNRHGNVSTAALNKVDLLGLGLFLGIYAVFLIFSQMPPELGADGMPKQIRITPLVLIAGMITQIVPAVMVIVLLLFRGTNFSEFFGLRWKHAMYLIVIAPLGVILAYAFVISLNVLGYDAWLHGYFGEDSKIQETVRVYQETSAITIRGMLAVSVVLIAPVVEEIVFRGYIYTATKRFTDRFFAAIFTSLLFGIVHFNINALLPLVFLALILTLAYELTGSLWAPISIHTLFNASTLINLEMQMPG